MATAVAGDFPGDDRTVAVRLSAADFRRRFRSQEFDVPPGWVLLVYRGGEFVPPLYKPGRHQWPTSLWHSLGAVFGAGSDMSGWLVRTAPVSTDPIPISGLLASDGLPFVATLAVTAQALDALRLVTGLDPARDAVTAADIEAMIAPHAEATLDAEVRGLSSQQLADAGRRDPLERAVLEAIRPPLQERGLMVLGMARPLRLQCPRRDEGQRIRQEYEALMSREQARAEGKRALDELLRSQEAEEVRQAARQADQQEAKARTFQRVQAMLVQMERDKALTEQELARIRHDADRVRLLSDADWGRFVDDLEVARARGGYQKHVAVEVARAEAEYALKEVHLRLDEREQELLRQRRAADLRARAEQARLEEQITTARLEERERQKTIAAMEEARRQAAAQRLQQERTLSQQGVVRIENEDNETTEVPGPAGLLEVANSDHLVIRLRGYVEQIRVANSDDVQIIAEKGYGALHKENSDGVRITAPSPEELEAEARRQRAEELALEAELRRQEEAREAAHRRRQALEDQRAELERRRLQALHELEQRERAQDAQADRSVRVFREFLQTVKDAVAQDPEMEPGIIMASAVVAFPGEGDRLLQITRYLYAQRMDERKLALLEGRRDEFIALVERHYGALGEALRAAGPTLRTVDDLLRVVDTYLRSGNAASNPVLRPIDLRALAHKAGPSVVLLHTPSALGTGFVIEAGRQPIIATSAHLFGELRDDKGNWSKGPACFAGVAYIKRRAFPLCLFWWKSSYDLAFLRPAAGYALDLPALALAGASPHLGEDVAVLGFPLPDQQPLRQQAPHPDKGYVNGERFGVFPGWTLTDLGLQVSPGNSGGPVLDPGGQVVGLVSGQVERIGCAVPLSQISEALHEALPYLKAPPSWVARVHDGVLVLGPAAKGWEVQAPNVSWKPLTLAQRDRGVLLTVVPITAPGLGTALEQGLATAGNPFPNGAVPEVLVGDAPYWQEVKLAATGTDALALLRWDEGEHRGILVIARPNTPIVPGWQEYALMMARYLYPE